MSGLPTRVKCYVLAVALAGVAAVPAWSAAWPAQWQPVATRDFVLPAIFGVLTAVALLFPLHVTPNYLLTLDIAADYAALLLFGPVVAMLTSGLGTAAANLIQAARGQRDRWNVLFNVGQVLLGVGLAGAGVYGIGGRRAPFAFDGPFAIAGAIAGALILDLCNTLGVAIVVGLHTRTSPLDIWLRGRRIGTVHAYTLLVAGLLIALLAPRYPWAMGLLVLLMGLSYWSLKETVDALERERAARGDAERAREAAETESGARGEFLSIASHELRTPVTSLRGYTQLLLRQLARGQTPDATRLQRALQVIDQQSEKLTRLVAQLLDISRIQSGTLALERQVVDLATLAADVVSAAQTTTERPIGLHVADPVLAEVDAIRLEQVLVNLVDNAVKYSVNDGPVDVEVLRPSAETVQVAVRDRGLGIPPEHRQLVFERFYQVGGSSHLGGMGLGLYISRQIVKAHGGSIEVEAPPDGGTRFVITLPVAAGGAEPGPRSESGSVLAA